MQYRNSSFSVQYVAVKRLPHFISDEEWRRLAREPSRRAPTGIRNLAALHAMYFAGLRVSEVCDLSARDLNQQGMTLRVRDGKGGRDRSNLGVPTETWAVFERWIGIRPSGRYFFSTLDGGRLSERYLHAMVGRYATRAQVMKPTPTGEGPIHPHILRHSFATKLVEGGVPVHDVQRALGHASLATTEVYLHVNDAKLADKLRGAMSAPPRDGEIERLVERTVAEQVQKLITV
jgi:site-specific recombinase XerD